MQKRLVEYATQFACASWRQIGSARHTHRADLLLSGGAWLADSTLHHIPQWLVDCVHDCALSRLVDCVSVSLWITCLVQAPTASGKDRGSQAAHIPRDLGETSEEELLQWQPVVSAKKQPAEFSANGKQGGRADIPARKPAGTGLPADTAPAGTQSPDAAELLPSSSSLLGFANSVPTASTPTTGSMPAEPIPSSSLLIPATTCFPATSVPATGSMPATSSTSSEPAGVHGFLTVPPGKLIDSAAAEADTLQTLQTLAIPAMSTSPHQLPSSASLPASSAVVAGPCLATASPLSTLSHALHAGHAVLPQLAPSLPHLQSAPLSFTLPASSPAAAAAALTASTDSVWPTVHAPEDRQSVSSWLSQASDTPTLRHSSASISSFQCTDSNSAPDTAHPLTAVTNSDAVVASPVHWHLLDTKELQAQTAALLSSLTASTDWDCALTDAPGHRQVGPAEQQNQAVTDPQGHSLPDSRALLLSVDSELQSSTLATAHPAVPDWADVAEGSVNGPAAPSSCSSSSLSCGSNSRRRASHGQAPASLLLGQLSLERLASGLCFFSLLCHTNLPSTGSSVAVVSPRPVLVTKVVKSLSRPS